MLASKSAEVFEASAMEEVTAGELWKLEQVDTLDTGIQILQPKLPETSRPWSWCQNFLLDYLYKQFLFLHWPGAKMAMCWLVMLHCLQVKREIGLVGGSTCMHNAMAKFLWLQWPSSSCWKFIPTMHAGNLWAMHPWRWCLCKMFSLLPHMQKISKRSQLWSHGGGGKKHAPSNSLCRLFTPLQLLKAFYS